VDFRLRPVTRHFARFIPGVEVCRIETLLLLARPPWDRDAPSGARPPHRSTARTPPCRFDRQAAAAVLYERERAMTNAAAAASPPISTVCSALRAGRAPVKRPLIQPKTARAVPVTAIDHGSAPCALECSM
jgi:hypothetical protein